MENVLVNKEKALTMKQLNFYSADFIASYLMETILNVDSESVMYRYFRQTKLETLMRDYAENHSENASEYYGILAALRRDSFNIKMYVALYMISEDTAKMTLNDWDYIYHSMDDATTIEEIRSYVVNCGSVYNEYTHCLEQ